MGRFQYRKIDGSDHDSAEYWQGTETSPDPIVKHVPVDAWVSAEDVYLSVLAEHHTSHSPALTFVEVVVALEQAVKNRRLCAELTSISSFDDYQRRAAAVASYPGKDDDTLAVYAALGLAVKVGSIAERFQKGYAAGVVNNVALKTDLGDLLWFVSEVARKQGIKLSDVAISNVERIEGRIIRR